jgi:hypothetical protein
MIYKSKIHITEDCGALVKKALHNGIFEMKDTLELPNDFEMKIELT